MRAAGMFDAAIHVGDLDVAVAGGNGVDVQRPIGHGRPLRVRMGDGKTIDAMIHDGLTNPFSGKHMAHEASEVTAELEMGASGHPERVRIEQISTGAALQAIHRAVRLSARRPAGHPRTAPDG